jgi:hypothetical protein
MQERGLSYAAPGAAEDVLEKELREGRLSLEELRLKEVDVALADATCFRSAGLAEIRLDVERSILSENSRLLDAFRDARASVLERSRRLVARLD